MTGRAANTTEAPGATPVAAPAEAHRSTGALLAWLRRLAPFLPAGLALLISAPRLNSRAVWLDEAYTIGATQDLATTWRHTGGTQAIYYLLMWPVTQLSVDRAWVRLPSLICAVLVVLVVHEIGRRLGGRRMALISSLILAVSWSLSRYAIEARSYALAMLLVSLAWLGLVAALQAETEEDRRRWWWVFVAATLLAPLAHGLAVLHFGSQLVVLLLSPEPRLWLRRCVPVALALAVEGVLLFSVGAGEVADWIEPLNWDQVLGILRMLLGRDAATPIVGALVVVSAVLVVVDVLRRPREAAWPKVVPVAWLLGAPLAIVGMSLLRPYGASRYVLGALPGMALLVGSLLARLRPAAASAAATGLLAVMLLLGHSAVTGGGGEEWPELAEFVAEHAEDGDRLLMTSKLRPAFDYAWSQRSDNPELVPLSPVDPLGEVRRFYDTIPGTLRSRLLADPTETTWYVDRDIKRLDDVTRLRNDPEINARYEATGPWEFRSELYVVRFEPREDR